MSSGRQLAIGDIHGCAKTLKELLYSEVQLSHTDELIFLGDYISKGPRVKEVLDTIIDLEKSGVKIHKLRGNHEHLLLSEFEEHGVIRSYFGLTLDELEGMEPESDYKLFFDSLEWYLEKEDKLLVHAGFDFSKKDPFEDRTAMLWKRDWKYSNKKAGGRQVIHGHTPTELKDITVNIKKKKKVIPIDGGCVFYKEEGLGHLLALDIKSNDLYIQENIDY